MHALAPMISLLAAEGGASNFVDLDVQRGSGACLLGLIVVLLLVDLLVVHREAHAVSTREAAIESAVWISIGVAFSLVVLWWFGGAATGEYISGYLIEKSLSIDNVFVWALIMGYFAVPPKYQHRVLFWGIFGALVMRAIFIFAGVALIERFDWILYVFGAFLLFTAARHGVLRQRARRSRQQPVPQARQPGRAEHRPARRAAPVHADQRPAAGDAAVRRARARRADRRHLRRRQRAGRARREPRAVHRVLVQRLRHPRTAGAVLPARRHARPLHATCSRAWRSSSPSSA